MSTTITNYLNSIPAGSAEYGLAQQILSLITTAAGTGGPANTARQQIPALLKQLFDTQVAQGYFPVATVLALLGAAFSTRRIPDIGVTGNVAISGSTVTATVGAY